MNWLRQTPDNPLFPDLLWSRPENRRYAGKLLIIGGHQQSFNAVSAAYSAALKAGIGTARVILPDSLQKVLSKVFPEAEYAASTPIGSFSRQALGTLLDAAEWADGVLLAGDFGKNSETAVLLEGFVDKYAGQLTITGDSLDYFLQKPSQITGRTDTTIVGSLGQVQKLAQHQVAIKQTADLSQVLNSLNSVASEIEAGLITEHVGQAITAAKGQISTTKATEEAIGPELAASASVWRLQQPEKSFEALTTAVYCFGL